MNSRRQKRIEQKNKIKETFRNIILGIILAILCYVGFGMYKENKIALKEETYNTTFAKVEQIQEQEIPKEKVQIEESYLGFDVEAKLIIPKLELESNVLKEYTKEGMEKCISKFWGPNANEIGNFCIAGHNYKKENKFEHLIDLQKGDELYLLDNKYGKYKYIVFDIYKVTPENLKPIDQNTQGKRVVTLITCTNYSKNRIIVQAIEE